MNSVNTFMGALVLLLPSLCLSQPTTERPFTVSVIAYSSPLQKVYLLKYDKKVTKIDSAMIDSMNNTIMLHGTEREESHYKVLFTKNGGRVDLAVTGGEEVGITYRLSSTATNTVEMRRGLSIEGSPVSQEMLRWDTISTNYKIWARQLDELIDELRQQRTGEQEMKRMEAKRLQLWTEDFDRTFDFVRTTGSSVCAYIGLISAMVSVEFHPQIGRDKELAVLVEYAQKRFPDSKLGKIALLGYEPNNSLARVAKSVSPLLSKFAEPIILPDTLSRAASSTRRGKYVLIDFWASWCKPCRQESPHLLEAHRRFKDKGLAIYSVSIDEDKEQWLKAIAKDGVGQWTHVIDQRAFNSDYIKKYGITAIPANFLVDPQARLSLLICVVRTWSRRWRNCCEA